MAKVIFSKEAEQALEQLHNQIQSERSPTNEQTRIWLDALCHILLLDGSPDDLVHQEKKNHSTP